jgi:hypothetical protein
MSQLKVDSIIPRGGLPSGASGGIIQMVQTIKTDKFVTSSTSYTDITGLSVTITPQSSSNKILVFTNVRFCTGASGQDNKYQILRGSTAISVDNFCRMPSSAEAWPFADINLDSPSTSSATTYKVQCKAETNEVFVNRDGSNRDLGMSYITVMEVGM